MRSTLKFLVAFVVAFIVMMAFRALVFTIYTVPGSQLEPAFKAGDRVMVNRWSYGLRTGGSGLFSYGRLCWQAINKGDLVAADDSIGNVSIGCCTALPGDTIKWQERTIIVPGKANFLDASGNQTSQVNDATKIGYNIKIHYLCLA